MSTRKLGLIGRDDVFVEAFTKRLRKMTACFHETTDPTDVHRGYQYQVRLLDEHDRPTGHILNVTVTLDRIEQPPRPETGR